ncbi:putative nucleotidyltransferase [Pirellula sp. SH-Sr6A]|uniref:nucleotidyltransferase domain-containing protein n=1 Tax=Pirellula sp. SH-Sr6A TaxID=1632865 RepID=UPI00078E3443|nr:nucleotidyltransferase domain-containing protein [Pirellula sp. SH-Sr6A]AMV31496.1 putative nucleotidyltransferase [Pirellula sp. SH-Sr6A]
MIDYEKMMTHVRSHPFPLVFATISGAHLYGFPSPDSDFDLRGVHLLPLEKVIGLNQGPATIEKEGVYDGLEIDLVTHDAAKFFGLMLKRNGYVLEQLLSPLVIYTTPVHEELKKLALACLTRHHAHHYLGFAATQWRLFQKESPPRVKPLLYTFRVLLTGIHLMRTGELEANLCSLNESAKLSYLDELTDRKRTGAEKGVLDSFDLAFFQREYERLTRDLEQSYAESSLPNAPTCREAIHDLLVRLRLGEARSAGYLESSVQAPGCKRSDE